MNFTLKVTALFVILIAGVALTGCESDTLTGPVAGAPVLDTAPPTAPTGLVATSADRNVKVSWDANVTDSDFAGFMVYRVVWGNSYPMLSLPIQDNLWIDDHPVNVACTYLVTALDARGNESATTAVNFLGEGGDEPRIHLDH